MIKLVIVLSTIRAGKPRAVEKMFMRKLPRTGFTNLEILVLYLNNPSEETIFGSNKIME